MNHGHSGNRPCFRFLGERLILGAALEQRCRSEDHQHNHDDEKNREDPAALSARLPLVYVIHLNSASHHHPIPTFISRKKNFKAIPATESPVAPISARGVRGSWRKHMAQRTAWRRWQKSAHRSPRGQEARFVRRLRRVPPPSAPFH